MILTALFLATLHSQQDFAIPAGASNEFRKLALDIEDAIVTKNFERGSKLVSQLPNTTATFRIDNSKVIATSKSSFQAAIMNGASAWQSALANGVTFRLVDSISADITFHFESSKSTGTTWQWVPKTAPPQMLVTIIPPQMLKAMTATDVEAFAKVSFGKYLGLASVSKQPEQFKKDITSVRQILSLAKYLTESVQDLAPTFRVPAGASPEFHHLVLDIEAAIAAKDFLNAEKLSKLLPSQSVTWSLDTSKLDQNQKGEFADVAIASENAWSKSLGGEVTFKRISTGRADIAISFEPVLSKIANSNQVAGAAYFLGVDMSQPRVEAVIGLKRGPQLAKVMGREVFNECQFAFGRYLGLAPSPLLGSGMGRFEGNMINANIISNQELSAAKKILSLSRQLRDVVQKRQIIDPGQPALKLERTNLIFKEQIQGDSGQAQMLVTNNGTLPLELEVRGDCGCITGEINAVLAPGKSTLLTGYFETSELTGDVHHNLILKSNDPDRPILVIPASITVIPRAEVVFSGSNTVYLDSDAKEFVFYVNSAEAKVFNILEASVIGMPFSVKYDLFQGEVTSFAKSGAKQMIRGYKVRVDTSKLSSRDVFGRSSATVYLRTDNPKNKFVKAQMFVQNGIVSLPENIYFGSPQGISDSTFVLIRLGRPFKVLKVSSDSTFLTFGITPNAPVNPSSYTIRATYNGKAPLHRFKGTITVETDDPKQPIMKMPFTTNQT